MTYKEKIETLIEGYGALTVVHSNEVKAILEEAVKEVDRVKADVLVQEVNDQIQNMKNNVKTTSVTLNNRLQVIVDEIKETIFEQEDLTITDHAAKIANAREFIKIEGDNLTDEAAYIILKEFRDDLDTMKLFKRMIGKKHELVNGSGQSNFPKTFGQLNEKEAILNTFDEFERIANDLFLGSIQEQGNSYRVYNYVFHLPTVTYDEIENEAMIIKLAAEIDNYLEDQKTVVENMV